MVFRARDSKSDSKSDIHAQLEGSKISIFFPFSMPSRSRSRTPVPRAAPAGVQVVDPKPSSRRIVKPSAKEELQDPSICARDTVHEDERFLVEHEDLVKLNLREECIIRKLVNESGQRLWESLSPTEQTFSQLETRQKMALAAYAIIAKLTALQRDLEAHHEAQS